MMAAELPRLAFIGCSIESTFASRLLIYRLLQNYPTGRLRILETDRRSDPARRLKNVDYRFVGPLLNRLSRTRVHNWYNAFLHLSSDLAVGRMERQISGFNPDAILTMAPLWSWHPAALVARRMRVPLYMIVHDSVHEARGFPALRKIISRRFGEVYRMAALRLCVCPYMEEFYRDLYGVRGTVIYPSRAIDSPKFEEPPIVSKAAGASLLFAYAGTVNEAYLPMLRDLAATLSRFNARLVMYSPVSRDRIVAFGLDRANVEVRTPVQSHQLVQELRNEADVLFLPMTHSDGMRPAMSFGFPSKLTDYTTTGLPILIWGPPYCSAVRWARDNPGVAAVVESQSADELESAVKHLVENASYRRELGSKALQVGEVFFGYQNVITEFQSALTGGVRAVQA